MNLRDELINRLLDEVIFLQTTKVKDEETGFDDYKYVLQGDLSENRTM